MQRAWLAAAGLLATAYAIITPPFQAPDEVAHYWRAESIAAGELVPEVRGGATVGRIPVASHQLVAELWTPTAGKQRPDTIINRYRFWMASRVRQRSSAVMEVPVSPYVFVPYLPAASAFLLASASGVPPLVTFYLGRFFNAWVALLIVYAAVRRSPGLASYAIAVASLPMTLYLFGSCSPDAVTVALALYVIAAPEMEGWFVVASGGLALSKAAYLLIPLARRRTWTVVAVIAAAFAVSTYLTRRIVAAGVASANPRAQLHYLAHRPTAFIDAGVTELRRNGIEHARELIGKLGWLDIPLPHVIADSALLLLVTAAVCAPRIAGATRVASAAIVLVTSLLIALTAYVSWTPLAAGDIEGLQGRYFLPVAPLALIAISGTWPNARVRRIAFGALAAVLAAAHGIAIARIIGRYY